MFLLYKGTIKFDVKASMTILESLSNQKLFQPFAEGISITEIVAQNSAKIAEPGP